MFFDQLPLISIREINGNCEAEWDPRNVMGNITASNRGCIQWVGSLGKWAITQCGVLYQVGVEKLVE